MPDIVCISHLRWDFVWQRPQHLLSRLAAGRRVLFVEEPLASSEATEPFLQIRPAENAPGIEVVQLVFPQSVESWIGHGDPHTQPAYERLLGSYLKANNYTDFILWLYTPMALDFVAALPHQNLIYDVMDQLAAFKGAPPELAEREQSLLRQADIVFTGGPSLYQAKRDFNPHTYLFASGVDIEHFSRASVPGAFSKPADLAQVPTGPLLGYYGVIDERMDLELLHALVRNRPEWQIVLLGPVAKIEPGDLPTTPNLHLLGMKDYEELPAYLSFFDVALIPFALNEATRYLSPTKTLEYLAAHKPVVSTALADVIELYGSAVRIAHDPPEFEAQVAAALAQPTLPGSDLPSLLNRYSWDNIARQMQALLESLA